MKKRILFSFLGFCIAAVRLSAQDTLPRFSLINAGNNRVIIGWVNTLENVKQISIQRSFDSLSGYKSILTVADPGSVQNGFMDAKAPNDRMFYRIYIMQDKGRYQFTKAKRPVKDTLRITRTSVPDRAPVPDSASISQAAPPEKPVSISQAAPPEKPVSVTQAAPPEEPVSLDTAEMAKPVVIKLNGFPGTADSVAVPVPVTLKKKPNAYEPSLYVFTCSDGYVCVRLPETEKAKKYSIKFFEKDIQLFELKELKAREFKIDKANFYHAGWFGFELYEDGKLLEKHKFYLEKDF